jgi:hypothetical protein
MPTDCCFISVEVTVRIKPQQVISFGVSSIKPSQTTDCAQAIATKYQRAGITSNCLGHEISDSVIDANDSIDRSRISMDQRNGQDNIEAIAMLIEARLELPNKKGR